MDDGSIDGSGAMLDEYARLDSRFTVIHQENKGVAAARNVALGKVSGVWLMFIDGDDIYHRNALSLCRRAISNYPGVDIIKFDYVEFDDGSLCEWREGQSPISYKMKEFTDVVTSESYEGSFIGGAYRFNPIRDIRFKPFHLGEDRVWLAEVIDNVSQGAKLCLPLYGYRQRLSSATHQSLDPARFKDEIGWRMSIMRIWGCSKKKVEYAMLRRNAGVLTEYISAVYFAMPFKSRREVFCDWMLALNECALFKSTPLYYKVLMKINAKVKSQLLVWLTCWVPYYLKKHGLHR